MASIQVTKQNFEAVVLKSDKPVLVDFWAPWCGPCRMVGPVVEDLSEEYPDIVFGKINVDEESELAEQFSIMSIPTLLLFSNGKVEKRELGAKSKAELVDMITG